MFLNAFGDASSPEYIVDVNPHKCRVCTFRALARRSRVPEFLKQYRPDVLLIRKPNYRDEISRQVSALGIAPGLGFNLKNR